MDPIKLNRDMDRALEALNEELKFYNEVLFGTSITKVHTRLGTYYTLHNIRSMLPTTFLSYENFKIYVGNLGLDSINKKFNDTDLYFNSLARAIEVAFYFGITNIYLLSDVTVDDTIDVINKTVNIQGVFDDGSSFNSDLVYARRNIYISAQVGFKMGYHSHISAKDVVFRNNLANKNFVFGISDHKYNNATVSLQRCDFVGVKAEIKNLSLIQFGEEGGLTIGDFGGIVMFNCSSVTFYIMDTSEYVFECHSGGGDDLLFALNCYLCYYYSGLDGAAIVNPQLVNSNVKTIATITTSTGTVTPPMNVLTNAKTLINL